VRYQGLLSNSRRWEGFAFRPGDIVIDTPPKCGTTWMQLLCAMLVHGRVELDRPLSDLSPWLDVLVDPLDVVVANLEAQEHRRIIKTHTPLDGVPHDDRVTYVCVGRDPRDVAVSFQHHWANLDLPAFLAARAAAVGLDDLVALGPPPVPAATPRPSSGRGSRRTDRSSDRRWLTCCATSAPSGTAVTCPGRCCSTTRTSGPTCPASCAGWPPPSPSSSQTIGSPSWQRPRRSRP
jgi:hypothetical protein